MTKTPPRIYNWLDTQLSIARHYGGCTFNGHDYVIDMATKGRPLVRVDVLANEAKAKKQAKKAETEKIATAQGSLL